LKRNRFFHLPFFQKRAKGTVHHVFFFPILGFKNVLMLSIGFMLLSACSTRANTVVVPTRVQITLDAPTSTPVAAQPLAFWESVSGIVAADQPNQWVFQAQSGDQISLRAVGGGIEVILKLQSADGLILGEGNPIETQLATGGAYTVIVEAANAGSYELGLGYTDRPNPNDVPPTPLPQVVGVPTPIPAFAQGSNFIGALVSGVPANGELITDADSIYTFEGRTGQYTQIEMSRSSGTIDPVIQVYDPNGDVMALDDDSAGNEGAILRNLRLPADGLYSIQAGGNGLTGGYTLRLLIYDQFAPVTPTPIFLPSPTPPTLMPTATFAPAMMGQRLSPFAPLIGTLQNVDDVAIFSVNAEAGEIFSIALNQTENSTFRGKIELVNPDGVVVASAEPARSDPTGEALIAGLRADIPGTYQVFVTSLNGATGQYLITYGDGSTRQDVERGLIAPDQAVQADISRRGLRDLWTVELHTGDVISAAASAAPGSTLDPILELVPTDDEDNILAIDDNNGGGVNALISNLRITEGGLYVLRVKAAGAATVGSYTLIWRYISLAPTPTALPGVFPVLSVDDSVENNAYNFYPFQGRAGERVRIRVLAADGTTFDPVAALLDPSGNVIAEADDTEGLNPVMTVELPADGTYTVRVNGYLTSGAYTVLVEELF